MTQLSPIFGGMSVPTFVPDIPLMRRITQEGNRVRDLLGITSPHEGKVVMHQGRPSMDILRTAPIIIGRLFRLPLRSCKHLRGGSSIRPCDKQENTAAFPPSFGDGSVLATDTSDPTIAKGTDVCNDSPDVLVKSITDVREFPVLNSACSFPPNLIPRKTCLLHLSLLSL